MKMRDIAPWAGIEPTSVAFQTSVLTISPHRLPAGMMLPMPTLYDLPEKSVQTTTLVPPGIVILLMLAIAYRQ